MSSKPLSNASMPCEGVNKLDKGWPVSVLTSFQIQASTQMSWRSMPHHHAPRQQHTCKGLYSIAESNVLLAPMPSMLPQLMGHDTMVYSSGSSFQDIVQNHLPICILQGLTNPQARKCTRADEPHRQILPFFMQSSPPTARPPKRSAAAAPDEDECAAA